ncbi:MAG: carbamoyltransferase HypF [Helicobacteraceae bacterium]|nr:carbamoyltransferase HypF [Helicobacteraceae bacterium]
MRRNRYLIKGQVQGVGFRPFIYKTAIKLKLIGYVNNSIDGVVVEIQGTQNALKLFDDILQNNPPLLARVDSIQKDEITTKSETEFKIVQSSNELHDSNKSAIVSQDSAICKECLAEIDDENNTRYHNYFATNCTNCGPRYSIIRTVPYDRINTAMSKFTLCRACKEEYEGPNNRRYHAQAIACRECGPKLELIFNKKTEHNNIISKTAKLIKSGAIVAIKGVGGFHIVCDATNSNIINRLREYKNRPTKPFAIMCKNLEQVKNIATITPYEEELLLSNKAPIVVVKKLKELNAIAPNIDRVGCFLAYNGVHHLLFKHLDEPIVATSANLSGEPIITNKTELIQKLPFLDAIVDFNREITNAVDDSVVQVVNNRVQVLRMARGFSPKVITLKQKINKKILAVGASSKNTIALAFEDKIVLSPHIGDLESLKAFEYFTKSINTFKNFYDFEPDVIICDMHPEYETTKWAKKQNKPIVEVQHHLAHIYSTKAEFNLSGEHLGFSFDGTGYGEDATLWGGEVFVANKRAYSFKGIKLLGAQKAIKEPRRVALSMLFDKLSLVEVLELDLQLVRSFSKSEITLLHRSYEKNLNAPLTSSVGRLFDGVASLCGIVDFISYEGEAGLLCESYYDRNITECFEYTIEDSVICVAIVETVLKHKHSKEEVVSMFINTLASIIVTIAKKHKLDVILSGGVFQNKTLVELTTKKLDSEHIKYYYNQSTPINDGGVALGQLYYALENSSLRGKIWKV